MEQSFVAWAKMRARRLPPVKLGMGDDAAVLETPGDDIVVTTDMLMDGVHFELEKTDPLRVGRKLVAANLSDLAAMAAEPVAVFLSMCIPLRSPVGAADHLASQLFEGVCLAAEDFQVAVAGGDTNCWDGKTVLSLTAIGCAKSGKAWTRSGALPGDLVVVTGPLGGSILGKHLDFVPRLDIAEKLRNSVAVHAAMDISDGLSTDLRRMCDASGCGAILNLDQIPISVAARTLATSSNRSPVDHALGDGEDFELLLAIPPDQFDAASALVGSENAIACGEFTSRTGLWMREGARLLQLPSTGFIHGQ